MSECWSQGTRSGVGSSTPLPVGDSRAWGDRYSAPAIQPWHRNDRVTSGLKDAANFHREVIGVMNVLDGFQADHNVEGSIGERQKLLAIQIDLAQGKGRFEIDDIRSQHRSDLSPLGKMLSQHTIGATDIEQRAPGVGVTRAKTFVILSRQLVATVHGAITSPSLVSGAPLINVRYDANWQ